MSKLLIQGPSRLKGEIRVHGAKNSTLPLMATSLLCDSTCVLHNCPVLSDVKTSEKILQHLGCRTGRSGSDVLIDPRGVEQSVSSIETVRLPDLRGNGSHTGQGRFHGVFALHQQGREQEKSDAGRHGKGGRKFTWNRAIHPGPEAQGCG